MPCSLEADHTLLCSTVPLGTSLSDMLEREHVVCRGVAKSEACLVSGLVGVQRGL